MLCGETGFLLDACIPSFGLLPRLRFQHVSTCETVAVEVGWVVVVVVSVIITNTRWQGDVAMGLLLLPDDVCSCRPTVMGVLNSEGE